MVVPQDDAMLLTMPAIAGSARKSSARGISSCLFMPDRAHSLHIRFGSAGAVVC